MRSQDAVRSGEKQNTKNRVNDGVEGRKMEYSINQELKKLTDVKIAQLASLLNLRGYVGEVHINGIEQGSLWQVITSCMEIRNQQNNHPFKDPVEFTHFSFNSDKTRYMVSRFSIELDHPSRFKIGSINYQNFDSSLNLILSKTVRINGMPDIPNIETARLSVTPETEKPKRKIGKSL